MSTGILSSLWAGLTSTPHTSTSPREEQVRTVSDTDLPGDIAEINEDEVTTPKADAQQSYRDVPTIALAEHDEICGSNSLSPPAQDVALGQSSSSGNETMMLPPPLPRDPRTIAATRVTQSSLGIPTTGPLPNRGPPSNSQQRAGTSSSRGKVLLAPGHSPMDWAALTKASNLSGVPSFQRVTPAQMKVMNGRKGKPIWSSWQGKVYNITPYLPYHPGGEKELMKAAGRDATKLFMDIHPWVNWEGMLSACLVGVLVSADEPESALDAMD